MRAFRDAVESKDHEAAFDLLADDVIFNSPAVFQPYEGKEAVGFLLSNVVEVFEDFEYTDELAGAEGTTGLVFKARVGDKQIQGWDYIRERDGKITELTVMIRPFSGLQAVLEAMGERIAAAQAAAKS
jgi:hypothetical protein